MHFEKVTSQNQQSILNKSQIFPNALQTDGLTNGHTIGHIHFNVE